MSTAFQVVFNHPDFIVIDKPSGLLSIPDRKGEEISLKVLLQQQYGTILTVHRIDKDTSGLIVFAKNEQAHQQLSTLFQTREITKQYLGIVHGSLLNPKGIIDVPIKEDVKVEGKMMTHANGKQAITHYELLDDYTSFSYVQFEILTGRTHQIRVHAQHLGNSIVCDKLYGDGQPIYLSSIKRKYKVSKYEEEQPFINRLGLHAWKLAFTYQNEDFTFEADIPKVFKAFKQQLIKLKK